MTRVLPALLLLLTLSLPCRASLITASLGGVVENPESEGPDAYRFTAGESFLLRFTYDTAAPDTDPGPGASYLTLAPLATLTTATGFSASFGSLQMTVTDGPTDSIGLRFLGGPSQGVVVNFVDPTGSTLSSTAVPTLADFRRFAPGRFQYALDRQSTVELFEGRASVVPEPSTLAGAVAGLLSLWGWGRKWKRPAV